MENQIEIKSIFTNWHKVDKKTAKRYVKNILHGATAMPFEKRIEYIEEKKLKGISVKELLAEETK